MRAVRLLCGNAGSKSDKYLPGHTATLVRIVDAVFHGCKKEQTAVLPVRVKTVWQGCFLRLVEKAIHEMKIRRVVKCKNNPIMV